MKKLSLVLILSLVLGTFGFQSCTKEDNDAMRAPVLPDSEMMLMDFNGFDTVDPDSRSFSNWFHAAVNVYFWTRTVYEVIHVPITALQVAFTQDAIYQGENTWLWSYSFSDQNGAFDINLYGRLTTNDEISWEMYVTKEGDFTDFLWFSGATAYDESYSKWDLNTFSEDANDPFGQMPFINIDFTRDLSSDEMQIRYTNIIPGHAGNGGYIQYGTQDDADHPVFYDIYKIEEDNATNILYNPEYKTGRVMDQKRFHDTDWHCWDANTNDVECE